MARRAGGVRFALAVVALALLSGVVWGVRSMWRLRHALADDHAGRAKVITGATSGLAWASELGRTTTEQTPQGTMQVSHADCFVSRLDGVRIEDSSTHVVYLLEDIDDVAVGQARLPVDAPGHVAVALDRVGTQTRHAVDVPSRQRGACQGAVEPDGSYREVSGYEVSPGARLTVRACLSDEPNVLVPCGDGLDVVTTYSLAAIRRNTAQESFFSIMVGAMSALSLLGIGSFVPMLRSSRPKAKA